MDFGLSNDDVFFVWELINHVMSCTITSTEKKTPRILLIQIIQDQREINGMKKSIERLHTSY